MRLSDFDYNLPSELIAQRPLKRRESCRLMVVDRSTGSIEHGTFEDLPGYFASGDCLALNDSKVLTCRLHGRRASGGKVEVFLLRQKDVEGKAVFEAMISPARVKAGETISFGPASCRVSARGEVTFEGMSAGEVYALGKIPLPPYIKREPDADDDEYYQTVYARDPGSVAAPTAGLHFTPGILGKLGAGGVDIVRLTLHVGTATFKPVKCEDVTGHVMGEEFYSIPDTTLDLLKRRPRTCAVGTTACRCLESWAAGGGARGGTSLFIYPGYRFRAVDRLITNFHLPRTTLFMLVCALGGTELIKEAYARAVGEKYRFYSYGDAMLII